MFIASGFRVIMTRETDISIHDEGITATRKQKTSDIHNRLAIAESQPNVIFLSIHQNKFEQSSSHGTQIFYSPGNQLSERLAAVLQENFAANLQPDNTRQTKKAGDNLYLMYNAKCPAVLVECGFLSNSEEAARLTDPEYQNQIAFTILGSVVRFLELDRPFAVDEP
jgi:N-acetylmuramoyl-L-alanine amidase